MKKYLFGIVVCLCLAWAITIAQYSKVQSKWETAEANLKAYSLQLDDEKNQSRALQLTVDQLEYFNDSIIKKLNDTRNELKVKDKQLKALQYLSSSFVKTDTLIFTQVDTLFKEPNLAIDTLIGDEWYKVKVGLKYPSIISISPEFKSEKHIVVFSTKETVNPTKKFFLFRWFQKKHTVLQINVVEKNPYIDNEVSRYIEVMR